MMSPSCPNEACIQSSDIPARVVHHGSFRVRCGRRRRYRCRGCGRTFSTRTNTPYFGLWCSSRAFERVALLSVEGMSRAAIARIEGVRWHTADRWLAKAAGLAQRFYERVIRKLFGVACIYAQVVKTWRKGRVIRVERRAVIGTARRLDKALDESEDSTRANTAYIERLNLTIRQSVAYLRRRSPTHARCEQRLTRQLELARCHYNFIRGHAGLRFGRERRTPAMVAGLCDRACSFRDVFAHA